MNIGTMKIDVSFLQRPHALLVGVLVLLAVVVTMYPHQRKVLCAFAVLFCIIMLRYIGHNCDRITKHIERLNAVLCIILLCGILMQ